jgi:serine/threonine protein kinase
MTPAMPLCRVSGSRRGSVRSAPAASFKCPSRHSRFTLAKPITYVLPTLVRIDRSGWRAIGNVIKCRPRIALTSGTKLGPYEIQSPLGAGGMGEVYSARGIRLDRTVAIKVLASHLLSSLDLNEGTRADLWSIGGILIPRLKG